MYVKPSLHPWDETSLIMMHDLLDMLLNLVCQYFIVDFCTYIPEKDWPVVVLFCCFLVRFWDECKPGLIE
jgi:hypothetical protein